MNYFYSTKLDIKSNCLHCMIPSSDRSVNDFLYSSFSQLNIENSDSTVAVLGKIVAIPPQKSIRISNLLAPSIIDQPHSNEVLPSHSFSADFKEDSCWYATRSWRCWSSSLSINSSVHTYLRWFICMETIFVNSHPGILISSWGRTGRRLFAERLALLRSTWMFRTPSTIYMITKPIIWITSIWDCIGSWLNVSSVNVPWS